MGESAKKCIESGAGHWSESERTISSQRMNKGGRLSAYPDSLVARIIGPKGEYINNTEHDLGAVMLHLRGDGLGDLEAQENATSKRVHFVCKGPPECNQKVQAALEKMLEGIHTAITEKMADPNFKMPTVRKG